LAALSLRALTPNLRNVLSSSADETIGEKNGRNETGIELSQKISALCVGQKTKLAAQALLNVCATVIANSCNTLHEVEDAVGEVSEKLTYAIHAYSLAAHPI
jgi:hypothetical protein